MNIEQKQKSSYQSCVFFNDIVSKYDQEGIKKLIEEYEQHQVVNINQEVVKGTVTKITDKDVFVNIKTKSDAIIPMSEFRGITKPKIGDEVDVYIEKQEDVKNELVVSHKKANLVKAWRELNEAYKEKTILKGFVKRKIKGGLVLDILGIEVFLPGSQINTIQTTDFDDYIGKIVEVVVAKINEEKDNIVVSRKILIEKKQAKQREAIIKGLQKGQVLSGFIKNITNFGLFINLGGIVGLLHKKDIAWSKKIDDLTQLQDEQGNIMFKINDSIEVAIKDFDLDKNHISLSTKMFAWAKLPEDIVVGSRIKGIVKEITDYYALIEVRKGVVGLLHISEMSHSNYIKHPQNVIKLEQEIDTCVLDINRESQELRLGIKQLTPNPWTTEAIKKYSPGNRYKTRICSISKNEVYLELEPGIQGSLNKKYISWTKKFYDLEKELNVNIDDELEVMLVDIDIDHRTITFSLRELEENPWPSFKKIFTPGSVHKASIIRKINSGVIVELEQGLQSFVPNKEIGQKNSKKIIVGTIIDLYVIDFIESEKKVFFSHSQKEPKELANKDTYKNITLNNTLGDLEVLKELKKELAEKDKSKRVKKK